MRIYSSWTRGVIVEVEAPTPEMDSDFNGSINLGLYIEFEFGYNPESTTARIWFLDGHRGGHLADWSGILTEGECLEWCEKQYGGKEDERGGGD